MSEYFEPEHYLPHRKPMCVLTRVINVAETSVEAEADLDADGVFAAHWRPDGELPEAFFLEVMAQTIGIWSHTYSDRTTIPDGDREADVGLLLSVRSIRIERCVHQGEEPLRCVMEKMMLDDRLAVFDGRVTCGGEVVASGRLTVFQPLESEIDRLLEG